MKKEKWDNLFDYFPKPFNQISEIEVYLFLEIPRLFSFKNQDGLQYIAYIAEIDYEFYDTKWIISQIDSNLLRQMLKEEKSICQVLINNYNNLYLIELAESDDVQKVVEVMIGDLLPSEDFYLNVNLPNEVNLSQLICEILSIEHIEYIEHLDINYNNDESETLNQVIKDFFDEFSSQNDEFELKSAVISKEKLPFAS